MDRIDSKDKYRPVIVISDQLPVSMDRKVIRCAESLCIASLSYYIQPGR